MTDQLHPHPLSHRIGGRAQFVPAPRRRWIGCLAAAGLAMASPLLFACGEMTIGEAIPCDSIACESSAPRTPLDSVGAGYSTNDRDGTELISDRLFQRGFRVMDPAGGAGRSELNYPGGAGTPLWDLAQWDSASTLAGTRAVKLSTGAYRFSTADKAVTIGPLDTDHANLIFAVNGLHEYGGTYHAVGDGGRKWAHLLASQRLSPPHCAGPGSPPLSEMSRLNFSIDARLLYAVRNQRSGYDDSRHAAQFLIYFTIQNLHPGSPGYGRYLWLGISLYDDRDPLPGLAVKWDDPTASLIYNVGLASLTNKSLHDQQWQNLQIDLLPHARAALKEAWARGYLADSHNLDHYRVGGMNMGWEVPGLNIATMQVKDMSLRAVAGAAPSSDTTPPSDPIRWDFNSDGDRQGWRTDAMTETHNGPQGGRWILRVPGADPKLISPRVHIDADHNRTIRIKMANQGNPIEASVLQVFWKRSDADFLTQSKSISVPVGNGGGWQTISLDAARHAQWRGRVTQIRVDPIRYGNGSSIGIDFISIEP